MEPQDTAGTATIDSTDLRAELLGRLGLPADATDADVAAAQRAARNLLAHAPDEQKAWAAEQLADVEAVSSLLADLPTAAAAAPETAAVVAAPKAAGTRRRAPKWVWAVAGVIVVVGAAFGLHGLGSSSVPGITGTPTDSSSSPALDQAQVGALMQKITANPKDVKSFAALAALYFQAGDYKNSATFSHKVLAIDPKQTVSWVALGAAQFNQGDQNGAKQSWLKAVALDPKNVEAHYDLGFLYLSGSKPDVAAAKKEWTTVIAIDPKSDIAKTVQTHLQSLSSPSPAPSSSK